MNYTNRITAAALSLVLGIGLVTGAVALAKGKEEKSRFMVPAVAEKPSLEVHVSGHNEVLVRGATVTAVNGNTIQAVITWGSLNIPWTINTSANTEVVMLGNGHGTVSQFAVGHVISFNGTLVTSSTLATVDAKTVKNWSLREVSISPNRRVFDGGSLQSVSSTTTPTSLVVRFGGIDYTVRVAVDTAVLNNHWERIGLGSFHPGDHIRVFGSASSTIIDATVVRNVSL